MHDNEALCNNILQYVSLGQLPLPLSTTVCIPSANGLVSVVDILNDYMLNVTSVTQSQVAIYDFAQQRPKSGTIGHQTYVKPILNSGPKVAAVWLTGHDPQL